MNRLYTTLASIACSAALAAAQVCLPAFLPQTPEQGPLGAGGTVRAVTSWDPDGAGPEQQWLIVGGEGLIPEFTPVDIAAWDGSNWRSLNATFSPGVVIRALTTYQGRLFVGGDFTTVNGQPASGLAVYDGQTWTGLSSGVRMNDGSQATVAAFTFYNGDLYIGGTFDRVGDLPASSVAIWDGTQLLPVPAPGGPVPARVRALVAYSSGVAVGAAAGSGLDAMGLGTATLGLWNGTTWQTLGPTPATGAINDLETDGATLLVAGASPTGASGLMRLNANNTWLSSIPVNFGAVAALERVVGGVAFAAAPTASNIGSVQSLSGNTLTSFQTGQTLVIALGTFRGNLVAGGAFISIAGRNTRGLATYTNQTWRPVGRGLQAPIIGSSAPTASINTVISDTEYDYYGGNFLGLASINSGYLARQSRTTGEWVPVPSPDGVVFRLRQLDLDGAGPEPSRIFAGLGLASGNLIASGLRSFDGQTWRNELGSITLPAASSTAGIYCVEVFEGDLVAGGNFTQIDTASVRYIVRRVNGVWQQMGARQFATTRDLLVHEGVLYAAGSFDTGISGVARWNGIDWATTGFPASTGWRLAIHDGRLVASASSATNGAAATIYELRGGVWFRLGTADFAEPLASLNGTLYAGYRRLSGGEFVASVLGTASPFTPRDMTINAQGDRVYVGTSTSQFFRTAPVPEPRPRFTSPPQLVTACPESDVTLSVQVTLDAGSQITWRRNGVPLPPQGAEGVSTDTLTLRRVTAADSGTYDVIGIGVCGVTTSQPVTLNVNESLCVPICGDIDFNNNDVFPEEEDVIAFFRVLAGGNCTE